MKSRRLFGPSAITGGIFLLVGLLALAESFRYPLGTAGQIGPAVFPIGLSVLLCIAAIAILVEDFRKQQAPHDTVPLRNLGAVVGGPAVFALLVSPFGLVPAIIASVAISALADGTLRARSVFVLAAGLALGCTLVFVTLLKLPIDPINWPF